jgi:neutral ceramidase
MSYKAGSATLDITPPLGTFIAGYFYERRTEGVIDPLSVNAIVVSDGSEMWALASCDLIGLSLEVTDRIRSVLSEKAELKPEQVMICCTHTHTGPVTTPNSAPFLMEESYLEFIIQRIADSIIMAKSNMVEAEAYCGRGTVEGVAFNRRYWMKEGVVATNPGVNNPNIIRPAGPVDPELGVVYFKNKDTGELISIITNYALHADIIEGNLISPDYPGYMRKALHKFMGSNIPIIFTRGSAGDINHIDVRPEPGSPQRAALSEAIGKMLAAEVIKVMEMPRKTKCQGPIWYRVKKEMELPLRSVTQEEIDEAERVVATVIPTSNDCPDVVRARRILRLKEMDSQPIKTEVQALGLGNVAFAGLPAEIFVEIGLDIKAQSQIPYTWVVDLANDKFAYVPTEKAYSEGGYEVNTSVLAPQVGNILKETALDLLK